MSDPTASIGFGVEAEEGAEFPWGDDFEDWWLRESGYPDDIPCPYTPDFMALAPGYTEDDATAYFAAQREWAESHPPPVELFSCGVCGNERIVFCVPGSIVEFSWGPEPFVYQADCTAMPGWGRRVQLFEAFMSKHFPDLTDRPSWLSGVYYG